MRLEPRPHAGPWRAVAAPVLAVAAALLVCAVPLALAGADVPTAYARIVQGSLGSAFAVTETLARATPLMLTGLAAALAFRARLWNIGGEGQLYLGAVAAVAVGSGMPGLPAPLLLPAVILAGALAGALLMLGPALLKLRFGVDEVVTTLLLNFVVLLFVGMMLEGPMKDPMSMGWPQSAPMLDAATLPKLAARTRVHAGLLMALVVGLAAWFLIQRTVWGYEMRAVGANAEAARFAGIPVERVLLRVAVLSGACAGLAGVGEVAGLKGYLTQDLSPGYGYAGIVVAMLAGTHPLGVLAAALLIAAIFVGADSMSRAMGVSSYIANLIVATSLLTMLLARLLAGYRIPPLSPQSDNARAAGILVATMLLFSGSDSILKLVFARLPVGEVAFLRNLVVCVAVLAFLSLRRRLPPLRSCLERTTLLRGCVELGTAASFFMGLRSLPLATATTLVFASPLMSIALAVLVLREKVDWRRWLAAAIGFGGVVLIVRPGPSGFQPEALWPLMTAFLVSLRDLLTRFIPPHVDTGAVTLTAAIVVMLGGLATLPFAWVTPNARELGLLLVGGLLISIAYATVVIAFRLGDMSFIAPFRYVSIPLAAVMGWLIFADRPTWHLAAGAAVIVASGAYIFHRERARTPGARQPALLENGKHE